jgi:hypothetical protein
MIKSITMKNAFLGVLFFIPFVNINAQSNDMVKLEKAVLQLVSLLENPNEKELTSLIAPNIVYSHSSGKIDTRESLIQSLVSGESDFVKIDITNQNIKKVGKSTFVVTHNLYAITNNAGKQGEIKLFILLAWEKIKGQWQLVARQAARV